MTISFEIEACDGEARVGRVRTARGTFATPAFMPVGTVGTVKAMTPEALARCGTEIILANTYHLMLRPGSERIACLGGVGKMMAWPGPVLTDSGGFQILSLSKLRKLSEKGVTFQSHIDGTQHVLTPERSVQIQRDLHSTITMALDECTSFPASKDVAAKSMELSMRWASRSKAAFSPQSGFGIFGIVQGGMHQELRSESVGSLVESDFDGYAIGGLAVGEGSELMYEIMGYTAKKLPADKPRYLMGVGRPADLVEAVTSGCDMFDCVLPTRSGRTGQAFVRNAVVNIRNHRHKDDPRPLDASCRCPTCLGYSRAYLHHLVQTKEILGAILITWHNLHYYQVLMEEMRSAIRSGKLMQFNSNFLVDGIKGDIEPL